MKTCILCAPRPCAERIAEIEAELRAQIDRDRLAFAATDPITRFLNDLRDGPSGDGAGTTPVCEGEAASKTLSPRRLPC